MTDFRTFREKEAGWWLEDRATVSCIIPKDGLLAVFLRKDVEELLDARYPHSQNTPDKIWWFNDTMDREIAECSVDRVYANPQVLWQHFMGQST